jgi:hypothetical protein
MPLISKTCIKCDSEFKVAAYRANTAKYCSIKCKDGRSEHNWIACAVCEDNFYRPASHIKDGSKCCSIKCRGILQRTNQPPGTDIPGVKKWLKRRNMIVECEDCGYNDHPEILVIHHRDRDRTNNSLFNLAILCPNCHAIEHYAENKDGYRHASTKRRKPKNNQQEYSRNVENSSP